MAKICIECGLKHDNKAKQCVNCGSELEVIQADAKRKRIIVIALVSIILIAATIIGVTYFSSPEAKVKSIMKAFQKNDVDAVISSFPDFVINYLDETETDTTQFFEEWVATLSDYIFSYNIDKVAAPSTSQKTVLLTTFYYLEEYGYDESKLSDVQLVWLKLRGGTTGLWNSSDNRFVMIKYDGKWFWWPFN